LRVALKMARRRFLERDPREIAVEKDLVVWTLVLLSAPMRAEQMAGWLALPLADQLDTLKDPTRDEVRAQTTADG
jgi:hypothetical protein